jgi:hypothetical protein
VGLFFYALIQSVHVGVATLIFSVIGDQGFSGQQKACDGRGILKR